MVKSNENIDELDRFLLEKKYNEDSTLEYFIFVVEEKYKKINEKRV